MEPTGQGNTLPLAADIGSRIGYAIIGLVGTVGCVWFAKSEGISILLAAAALCLVLTLFYIGGLFARLHIAPEGIAITLFGLTLRRFPADKIRVIVALRKYHNKSNPHDVMAICINTVEELTALGTRHMPKLLQNEADRWYGQTAAKYLYRRAESLTGEWNLHKHILWLDWEPSRLRLLQKMYPNAQWLDGTEKKIFEKQLTE